MNRINLDFDKIRVLPYTKYGKTMYYYRSYWTQKKYKNKKDQQNTK